MNKKDGIVETIVGDKNESVDGKDGSENIGDDDFDNDGLNNWDDDDDDGDGINDTVDDDDDNDGIKDVDDDDSDNDGIKNKDEKVWHKTVDGVTHVLLPEA